MRYYHFNTTVFDPMRLILLPGTDGSGRLFFPLQQQLSTSPSDMTCRVLSYEPTRPMNYEQLTESVLSRLQDEQGIVLLAESFSGPIAIACAEHLGSRIRALIQSCTFAKAPTPLASLAARFIRYAGVPRSMLPLSYPWLLGMNSNHVLRNTLKEALADVTPEVLAQRMDSVATVDVRHTLTASTVPLAILSASHDRLLPRGALRLLVKCRPDASVYTLSGPHLLLQSNPAAAAQAIQTFLHEHGLVEQGIVHHGMPVQAAAERSRAHQRDKR